MSVSVALTPLHAALDAGVGHLLRAADEAGAWSDYRLPVGRSTSWVTAHVAGALHECVAVGAAAAGIPVALDRAEEVLGAHADEGWGFNGSTGPDADSTAVAVLFLAPRGHTLGAAANLLEAHRRPDGGYATYLTDDAWGVSHPCVTPVVALALRALGRPADVRGYVDATAFADGTWPSYWWRGSHYSTYWNLVLLRELGVPVAPLRPVVGAGPTTQVRSVLDLACVAGITALRMGDAGPLLDLLLSRQRPDGGFDGGADLRVTRSTCLRPWEQPEGELYATTADC